MNYNVKVQKNIVYIDITVVCKSYRYTKTFIAYLSHSLVLSTFKKSDHG